MSRNPFINENEFLRGYLECALFASNDPDTEEPLDDTYTIDDFDPEWREIAREDCAVFCRNNPLQLSRMIRLTGRDEASQGHDFWLTRNHHGTGYWDRYLDVPNDLRIEGSDREEAERVGKRLTDACEPFPEIDLLPISGGKVGV